MRRLLFVLLFVLLLATCAPPVDMPTPLPERITDEFVIAGTTYVSRWSVYELALTAAGSYSNSYTDVVVTATFIGPSGQIVVKGFWDGGQTWRVRFTPNETGSWTYSIASSPSDAGLTATGAFTVTAADSGDHGFWRASGYNWVWDDGTREYLWGQTYYEIIQNAVAGGGWQSAIDQMHLRGINKVRLLVYPWSCDTTLPREYPYSIPFSSDANHDSPNVTHWQALDDIVEYMAGKEQMLADLILFADCSTTFGTTTQDNRYARYIMARYAAYPNVVWTMTNEWNYTGKEESYWNALGTTISDEDPWGDGDRMLSIHQQTRLDFQFFAQSWPTYANVQYGTRSGKAYPDQWGNLSITANWGHSMPVLAEEYGYLNEKAWFGRTQARQAAWGVAVAGGHGSVGDWTVEDGSQISLSSDWRYDAAYNDLGYLIGFWDENSIPYWNLAAAPTIITGTSPSIGTRAYAGGIAGQYYVIYTAVGGSVTIQLPAGSYVGKRYNPITGATSTLGTYSGGTSIVLVTPDANDWVYYFYSNPIATTTATVTAGPSPTPTRTPTSTVGPTPTPVPGSTNTPTPVPTVPTPTHTATVPISTVTPTPTATPTATATSTPTAIVSGVALNEIASGNEDSNGNGVVEPQADQCIEIYNASGSDQDITGWTLKNNSVTLYTYDGTLANGARFVIFGRDMPENWRLQKPILYLYNDNNQAVDVRFINISLSFPSNAKRSYDGGPWASGAEKWPTCGLSNLAPTPVGFTPNPTFTPASTYTPIPPATATPTITPTWTATVSTGATATPTATATRRPGNTPTRTPTVTPTPASAATATPTRTPTAPPPPS